MTSTNADCDAKINQLKSMLSNKNIDIPIPNTKDQNFIVNDDTFKRYLKARNNDVRKAGEMLIKTIEWRRLFGVEHINNQVWSDVIRKENETGKMYVRGHDRNGRALLYMRPKNENSTDHDAQLKHLVYQMERAVMCMTDNKSSSSSSSSSSSRQDKLIILIDYDGYSIFNAPPMKTAMATLSILQNHYPERLHKAYCIHPPWIFQTFWSAISPFIDPVTKSKIVMINKSNKDLLTNEIDTAILEASVGGSNQVPFNSSTYMSGSFNTDFHTIISNSQSAKSSSSCSNDDCVGK